MNISFGGGSGDDNPLSAAADAVSSAAGDAAGAAASLAGDAADAIGGALSDVGDAIGGAISGAVDVSASIGGGLTGDLSAGVDAIGGAMADVGGALSGSAGLDLAVGLGGAALGAAAIGALGGFGGGGGALSAATATGPTISSIFGTAKVSKSDLRLVKARFRDDDTGDFVLECLFNPSEYSITKKASWSKTVIPKLEVPMAYYTGGDLMTMSLTLRFDTMITPNHVKPGSKDVRSYTDILLNLMKPDPDKFNLNPSGGKGKVRGRPHTVSFHWGNSWSFKGVITSVKLTFTLFEPNGTPVRATAAVDMQQVLGDVYPRQNPTSGGESLRASRVIQPGDTLDLIAYQEYGDSTLWRVLAQANNIEDPRAIRPGQRLMVPSR